MDFIRKAIRYFHCAIVIFLRSNSICKRLSLSVPGYMDFYMSHLSAYLPKDADLIEKVLFPCPRGAKSAPSPALRQRMGRSCFFTLYFLRFLNILGRRFPVFRIKVNGPGRLRFISLNVLLSTLAYSLILLKS